MKKLLGKKLFSYPVLMQDGKTSVYIDRDEAQQFGKHIHQLLQRNPHYGSQHIQEFKKRSRVLLSLCKQIASIPVLHKTNAALLLQFKMYLLAYQQLMPFMITPHLFQSILESEIRAIVADKGNNQDVSDLFIPWKKTFETAYQEDLYRLSIDILNNPTQEAQKIRAFHRSWAWISMDDYPYEALSENDIRRLVDEQITREQPKSALESYLFNQKRITKKADQCLRSLFLSREEKQKVYVLQMYIWLRTERLKTIRQAFFYTKPYILEIGRRAGVSEEELYLFLPSEICTFLKKNKLPSKYVLSKRKEGYVMALIDGKNRLYAGKHWVKQFEKLMGLENGRAVPVLHGSSACLGKACGHVKVIFSKEEVGKIQQGDVLVTSMTTPDYVIAMRRASAIVTDEGGVTCHAAIVAREMNIPCVIGTGNATQVLKDGDIVQVDANEGIVHILK